MSQEQSTTANMIGKPVDRVDGRLKVTGGARYSAEIPVEGVTHAVLVESTIGKGRIRSIDAHAAEHTPGVLAVITHLNMPRMTDKPQRISSDGFPTIIRVLQDPTIHHYGQHIGVVVAETLEQATHAAALIRVSYERQKLTVSLEENLVRAYKPKSALDAQTDTQRGDPQRGLVESDARIEATYTTPIQHHNPMEPHATIATWENQNLTIYNSTQNVFGEREALAATFDLPEERVCVVCAFLGGGFGSKYATWQHTILAALAARCVNRPVKLVVTREQMFTAVGYRSKTIQHLRLGAKSDGRLTAILHEGTMPTSMIEEFIEPMGKTTRKMYACPNTLVTHRAVRLDINTPTIMRAPGETPGSFGIECAMDELAYELRMDPIQLRERNHADHDPESGKPWSSKSLNECFRQGALMFGWERRDARPRSMRDGRYLVGLGTASATYPTNRQAASALARILPDGTALVQSGAHDIGTGAYTILTQVAADALGLAPERVRFELGDTRLPRAPGAGGSWTSASVGSAVHEACLTARGQLVVFALRDRSSPLYGLRPEQIAFKNGQLFSREESSRGETCDALLARNNLKAVEGRAESKPDPAAEQFSKNAFGAQFCEVRVDKDLGMVRVTRFLSVIGAGRILNPKTARSQIIGGVVWGIGMALMEETVMDTRFGRYINANLGEYHVPVNADIQNIEAFFVEEHDPHVNPLGVKGIGEIGIVGAAAAIANAVFHATGKRIRDLPITPDKLL